MVSEVQDNKEGTESRDSEFVGDVKEAVAEVATDLVDKVEMIKETPVSSWLRPLIFGAILLLAPLTISKVIPYFKQQSITRPAEVKANPAAELDATFDKVRALSQIAASDVKQRKSALDERAVLIGRIKTMADTTDFKGASDLALEWLNRIQSDAEPDVKEPVVVKPKPAAAPVKEKSVKEKAKPAPEVEVRAAPVPAPKPKCGPNDIGDCVDWRRISRE